MNKLKRGTVREDGKIFWRYQSGGSEYWVTPETFAAEREKHTQRMCEKHAARTLEQREQYKQYQREYRAKRTLEQREQYKQQQREYRAKGTPEQRKQWKQQQSEYRKRNPEICRAGYHRHRARKLAQLHPELDRAKEQAIHNQCVELTHSTGILHHVDHIIPLACGGWHHHDNLQCLPANLNCQKNDNPVWEHHGYKSWRDVPTHLWPEQLDKLYCSLLI
jgi:hypothetical protein